jgi:histidine triad (HIT) family protein
MAFKDIAPQTPVHVIIIPREHIVSAAELTEEHAGLMGHIWTIMPKIAGRLGVADSFRVTTNSGEKSGQTVFHLHFHLQSP